MSSSDQPPESVSGPGVTQRPTGFEVQDTTLWVELEIEMDCVDGCPIACHPSADEGSVQLTGPTCHVTLVSDDDSEDANAVRTSASAIDQECLCPAVYAPGFAPVELRVEGGSLFVSAYVEDRERLTTVIDQIRDRVETWHLRCLTTPNRHGYGGVGMQTDALEQLTLTEKQEEAVTTAVEMGYYSSPRETTLGDLADRLGVSLSALSQRLNAVEMKLVNCVATEL
jgi:hypothetical protein